MIFLLASIVWIASCDAFPATSRLKRQQRGQVQNKIVVALPKDKDDAASSSTTSSGLEEGEVPEEVLWGLAGQTSRRKRQRGRKPSAELREEDDPTTQLATEGDDSSAQKPQHRSPKKEFRIDAHLLQPEEIENVKLILPTSTDDSSSTTILGDITFVNGTTTRVDPQHLHQRVDHSIWMAIRASLNVTASELGAIVGNSVFTTREKLALKKAGLVSTNNYFVGNLKACEWGLKMEPKALRQYIQVTGNNVTETGLHILQLDDAQDRVGANDSQESALLVGASPDGLVLDTATGQRGLLEIKSLWGRRNKKELPQFDHCPNRFYDQIQGQLAVCGLDFCDLMMYIPPSSGPAANKRKKQQSKNYCILRVMRDEEYWEQTLLPAVQSFCAEVYELQGTNSTQYEGQP